MSSTGETSAEVQKDAEAERAELVSTLDQLRENLKPANVIDEVLASAKLSTNDISDKVWQTARDNPIPATFIALGAAMLVGVGSGFRPGAMRRSDVSVTKFGSTVSDAERTYPSTRTAGADTAARVKSQLQSVGAQAAASASRIASSVRNLRREADRPISDTTSTRAYRTHTPGVHAMPYSTGSRDRLSGSLTRLLDEQPLVLAAVGVAIGAAIGAALPSTDAEGRLLGDASVSLRGRAQDLAQSELAHLKETATSTFDQLKQNVADRGLSKDNLTGLVQDAGNTVRGAVGDVADHAADTAGLKNQG